jgi:hypothetical protein
MPKYIFDNGTRLTDLFLSRCGSAVSAIDNLFELGDGIIFLWLVKGANDSGRASILLSNSVNGSTVVCVSQVQHLRIVK